MNTIKAIAAAQKYLGAEATATSFNGLMLQAANKYLTTDRVALNDAVLDALNQYLTNDRVALSDAMRDAALQYLNGDPTNGDPINAALTKYIVTPETPPPANTGAPVISGTPSVGNVLTTTNGTWTNSPTDYTYQWRRNGVAISGATASTYTIVLADDTANITCAVTAANAGGSAAAVSNALGPVTSGPTYTDFEAHIATLATDGVGSWSANMAFLTDVAHAYRITCAAVTGGLYGSPWLQAFALNAGQFCRVIQHGLPTEAVFNAQIAAGREVFVRTVPVSNRLVPSVTRNGYTSDDGGATPDDRATFCTELIYWDGTQAQKMNPSTGAGPTPYTW